ncbi:hypothetical protein V2S66_24255 [Streptomyces sp. V4-01]|uniref:Uncharacterized protein n=1 Tax=Actinacidiphila polyblastidii TaxID=3110430 RepID=A0ABU7PIG8_9ACTN|nr:hypothetical protein [Streptomyces sp. V4-01]
MLDSSAGLLVEERLHPRPVGESPRDDGWLAEPLTAAQVRVCANCSCCVDGLCRPGQWSGCPDALDSRWPYPCPCTSNTMDAPLP